MNEAEKYVLTHKFGINRDIDTVSVPEDVWEGGGEYPFPSAAGVVVVYSDSASDNGTGTGAHGLVLEGLDANYNVLSETIELQGTTTVTAVGSYIRTFRAYVTSAGATEVNEGLITVETDNVTTALIGSAMGQTLMCVYTTPNIDKRDQCYMLGWSANLPTTTGANAADIRLQARTENGAWRTKDLFSLDAANRFHAVVYPEPLAIEPKQDWRVTVDAVSANNTVVSAIMDFKYANRYRKLS